MADDFLKLATAAHRGTSFDPGRRGNQHAEAHRAHLEEMRAWIAERAPAEMVEELHADYAAGYTSRYRAWLQAMSRTLSPMVTGPANFPTRRNEKRLATEHRRLEELLAYERKGRRRIAKAIARANRPDDPHAAERENLERLETLLETKKEINKIVRRKKLTDDEKVAAIVERFGFKEATARKILEPDFAGRVGFPGYELTSLREKVKRAEARLRVLETVPDEPFETDGATIAEDPHDDRLRIHFDEKPDEATRTALKRSGFRWSPRNGAWQRKLTAAARADARRILETLNGEA